MADNCGSANITWPATGPSSGTIGGCGCGCGGSDEKSCCCPPNKTSHPLTGAQVGLQPGQPLTLRQACLMNCYTPKVKIPGADPEAYAIDQATGNLTVQLSPPRAAATDPRPE